MYHDVEHWPEGIRPDCPACSVGNFNHVHLGHGVIDPGRDPEERRRLEERFRRRQRETEDPSLPAPPRLGGARG